MVPLTGSIGHALHVNDDNLDAKLVKQLDHGAANAAGAARHDDNLSRPVVAIIGPVIARLVRKPARDGARQAQVQQRLDAAKRLFVENGHVVAALGVAREQHQGQQQRRVEGRPGDELEDGGGVDALAGQESVVHRHRVR